MSLDSVFNIMGSESLLYFGNTLSSFAPLKFSPESKISKTLTE